MIKPCCGYLLLSILSLSMTKLFAQESCESGNPDDEPDKNVSKLVSFLDFVGNLCQDALKQKTCLGSLDDGSRTTCCLHPMDCEEIYNCGNKQSGIYKIWPKRRILEATVNVFCDMDTDGGGWIVFQRRGDFGRAKDYFYNTWENYKKGFGNLHQDFWLGNDIIFALSHQRLYSLRVHLESLENETRYATYDTFWIDDEHYNYKLHISGYSGTAGDSLLPQNENSFSTKDRDNDSHKTQNCAQRYKGGWWYADCHSSNLNGLYLNGTFATYADGMEWIAWKGRGYSYPFVEMKMRSSHFTLHREMMDPKINQTFFSSLVN